MDRPLIYQSITQSTNQSINPSINQPINQSLNQEIPRIYGATLVIKINFLNTGNSYHETNNHGFKLLKNFIPSFKFSTTRYGTNLWYQKWTHVPRFFLKFRRHLFAEVGGHLLERSWRGGSASASPRVGRSPAPPCLPRLQIYSHPDFFDVFTWADNNAGCLFLASALPIRPHPEPRESLCLVFNKI